MGKEGTLKLIEIEISEGLFHSAKERLHGLLNRYGDDLEIRSRLGDVYWIIGDPIRAGKYWFFAPLDTIERRVAVRTFLRSCNDNPNTVWRRLKFRGDSSDLPEWVTCKEVNQRVLEIEKEGVPEPPSLGAFIQLRARVHAFLRSETRVKSYRGIQFVRLLGIALLFALALIGLMSVTVWITLLGR